MPKANFENLRIYQLSEDLADQIGNAVVRWDNFAKDTVGKQLVRAADSIGANISEGSGEEVIRTTGDFCGYPEALFMRLCIGCDAHICGSS